MTAAVRIADVLAGQAAVGSQVTVQGWVRTRRDSKAGLSFIQVHDGSSFSPVQIVAKNDLANYEDDVQRLDGDRAAPQLARGDRDVAERPLRERAGVLIDRATDTGDGHAHRASQPVRRRWPQPHRQ